MTGMVINMDKNTISQQVLWKGTQFDWSKDKKDNVTLPKQQKYQEN